MILRISVIILCIPYLVPLVIIMPVILRTIGIIYYGLAFIDGRLYDLYYHLFEFLTMISRLYSKLVYSLLMTLVTVDTMAYQWYRLLFHQLDYLVETSQYLMDTISIEDLIYMLFSFIITRMHDLFQNH